MVRAPERPELKPQSCLAQEQRGSPGQTIKAEPTYDGKAPAPGPCNATSMHSEPGRCKLRSGHGEDESGALQHSPGETRPPPPCQEQSGQSPEYGTRHDVSLAPTSCETAARPQIWNTVDATPDLDGQVNSFQFEDETKSRLKERWTRRDAATPHAAPLRDDPEAVHHRQTLIRLWKQSQDARTSDLTCSEALLSDIKPGETTIRVLERGNK